jgi:type IV secretion system protein VirD4
VSALLLAGLCAVQLTHAADTSYLKEMPSPDRVMREIKGSDAKDTAARQAAAVTWLIRMMNARIGRPDANLNRGSLSAPERDLMEAYYAAATKVLDPIQATFDPKCQGPNCDATRFRVLIGSYQESPALQKEVEKFFSPQWLADYQRDNQRMEARINAANQRENAALEAQTAQMKSQNSGPGAAYFAIAFFKDNIGYLVFGGLVGLWLMRRKKKKREIAVVQKELAEAPEVETRRSGESEMQRLGTNPEQRAARIEDLFNKKTETLSMALGAKAQFHSTTLGGTVSRSLAAMQGRERETLRAAYHLFNLGALSPQDFYHLRLALLFGDGKAQAFNTRWSFSGGGHHVNDFASAVKSYTNMSSESAISAVLQALEYTVSQRPDDRTVQLLRERLLGGGATMLSSTAAFASAQDARKPALILGLSEENGQIVTFTGEGSVITIAPPGSGKTQCHVFPTLLSWKGPAVVLDVKGEIYAGTSKWRQENVGPVYKFAPLDPGQSASWNPLSAVRSDPDYLWEDSRFLADMMLVPSGAKDPFWENRARDVLTAAIARACLTDNPAKRSLAGVLDIFHGLGWDAFLRELESRVDIRSLARAANSLKEMDSKMRESVLQTGLSSLSAWDGDRIERATRKSDWSPLDLRGGKNPTIYICLKPNEVDSYVSLLRVFIAQHIRTLESQLPSRDAAPILFLLDELPRLRHMPPVEEALEVGRQYGIRLWMFAQSLGQLEAAYENAEGMVGSCVLRMYMNPSAHDGTAQKLSDEIGMQEGVLDNTRQKIVEAPVLAGPDYKDHVLVMATGFRPFRVKKSFAYQDPTIASRMGSL